MGWEILREEHPHFVVRGNAGEFRVHQGSLSEKQIASMRQKLSGGGKVEPAPKASVLSHMAEAGAAAGGKVGGAVGSLAGDTSKAAGQFVGASLGHLAGQVAQRGLDDEVNGFFPANPIPTMPISPAAAVQRGHVAVDPSLISPEMRAIPVVGQKLLGTGRQIVQVVGDAGRKAVQHFDDGGPVQPDPQSYPNPDAAPGADMDIAVALEQSGARPYVESTQQAQGFQDLGNAISDAVTPETHPYAGAMPGGQPSYVPPQDPAAAPAPAQAAPVQPASFEQQPTQAPGQQTFQTPESGMVGPGGIMAASKATEKAITNRGQAEETAQNILANTQQTLADAQRQAGEHLQQNYAANRSRLEQMFNDLQDPKNDIQPDHFWSTRSEWQKVSAGIGMILSGIGSGLTGQPNMAAQFIQRAIDRDIEAQKANLARKQGALSFFRDQMKDDMAAEQMTRAYLLNSISSQIAEQSTRNAGTMAAENGKVLAAQTHQQAIALANQAVDQVTQAQLHKIQLAQATRAEQLIRGIYGTGGAPDQNMIREAGARGLIKPVVTDRKGTLGIARSDDDAKKLNDELPPIHSAQDIVDRMQQLRNREGPFKLIGISDAANEYANLRRELGVQLEKSLAGRVSDQTIKAQVDSIGANINQFWHSADPLAAVRQTLDAQHRAIVNQRTWSREGPNVTGQETGLPARGAAPAAPPPVPGAVHITDGARGGWLVPGKPMPKGWRPG